MKIVALAKHRNSLFGLKRPVTVGIITTGGGISILKNLQNKAHKADVMFSSLIKYMNDAMRVEIDNNFPVNTEAKKVS